MRGIMAATIEVNLLAMPVRNVILLRASRRPAQREKFSRLQASLTEKLTAELRDHGCQPGNERGPIP
jgi:hypothetical protein